jgi:hypothetical protein
MKVLSGTLLCLMFTAGCRHNSNPCDGPARPSAIEIFNLRSKCAELAKAIEKEDVNPRDKSITTETESNYSISENRCYVTVLTEPDLDTKHDLMSTDKWWEHVVLSDGQTGQFLASTSKKGPVGLGPGVGSSGFVPDGDITGYEKAQEYIDKKMKRDQ